MTDEKPRKGTDPASRLSEIREGGKKKLPTPALEIEEEGESAKEAFSNLSADRNQKIMLELRFKTANAEAFPYSYLVRARFDPSKDIRLDFSLCEVTLKGRNLAPLFAAIIVQRAAFVQEVDDLYAEVDSASTATIVTKIEVADSDS